MITIKKQKKTLNSSLIFSLNFVLFWFVAARTLKADLIKKKKILMEKIVASESLTISSCAGSVC